MRKTIFTALVTLLVMLAVVSCDSTIGQKPEYTADGLVTLTVNTGGTAASRSLIDDIARDEANYMEVIFEQGGKYYRAQGFYGTKLRINVPEGTYDTGNAIILIGRYSDGTLLATGVPAASIDVPDELEITFNVTSLEADISTTGAAFDIDESTVDTDFSGETRNGVFAVGNPALGNPTYKCFQVSTGTPGVKASLTITGFGSTGDDIFVNGTTPLVTFNKNLDGSPDIVGSDLDVTSHSDGDPIGTAGLIEFEFNTDTKGKYVITFEIPVVGLSPDPSAITNNAPLTWYIRGGTEEGQPDFFGVDDTASPLYPKGDEREGVALVVKDDPFTVYGVVVKPPVWP